MQVLEEFHRQESIQTTLDQALVKRHVQLILRCGMGWFMGLTRCRAHPSARNTYDFRATPAFDQSTHSIAMPLDKYSADHNAQQGAWVILEPGEGSEEAANGGQ